MDKRNKINQKPTILVFVYNRIDHLKKTISSLKKNKGYKKYNIIFFCDGPKNLSDKTKIKRIIKEIKSFKGFSSKKIVIKNRNFGLAKSVINGINYAFSFKKIQSIIVLEDDLILSPFFLEYMTGALNSYKCENNIGSVSAYSFFKNNPKYKEGIYLSPRHSSWGWGTWKETWLKFKWSQKFINRTYGNKVLVNKIKIGGNDLKKILKSQIDKKINSWSIIFDLNCALRNLYCVCPNKSMVYNIGLDNSGTHNKFEGSLNNNYEKNFKIKNFPQLKINYQVNKDIQKIFEIPLWKKLKNKIIKFLM